MKTVTRKAMTLRYGWALAIVALLSIGSHLALIHVLATHRNSANIINISGRQRMLSQRIASMALQYEAGNMAARADLTAAIDEFQSNFTELSSGPAAVQIFGKYQLINDLYHSGPEALDNAEPAYAALARSIAAAPPGDPKIAPQMAALLAQAEAPLLNQLNAATLAYVELRHNELMTIVKAQTVMLLLIIITLCLEMLFIFRPMIARIMTYTNELQQLSAMDPLSQVHTRRGFLSRCTVELGRVQRYAEPACMLLIGIDNIKAADTEGHNADRMLAALGPVILRSCRAGDIVGRWDQEHFIVLLPLGDSEQGRILAQTIQENVEQLNMKLPKSQSPLSISAGIAEIPHNGQDLNSAIARADGALFQAKRAGTGQVEIAL